ncbi:MAG: phosphatase PAP2 family protein [Betaproteobacteria bacterium]
MWFPVALSGRVCRSLVVLCGSLLLGGCLSSSSGEDASTWVTRWNQVAIDAGALDHTPVQQGETRTFGHQLGPGRTSRALAVVHIAMFDAVVAINGGYRSYTGLTPAPTGTSMQAAIAQAAHDTLVALYPSHSQTFARSLAEDLQRVADTDARANGVRLGQRAASAILALRAGDGSGLSEPYSPGLEPGKWRSDPINPGQIALGSSWHKVKPFVIDRSEQFRVPPPPPLNSLEYVVAFTEVRSFGGDGVTTQSIRTEDQRQIGIYWAYDGVPGLGAPPRLYNQIALQIGKERGLNGIELARLMALVNISMADAGIANWESKFFYNFWRPVGGIREADAGTGPTGAGDGNALTIGDVNFTPLGAPASNLIATSFTPPFPAYPSGHAGFGAAMFQVLRHVLGTDNVPFTFVSDELNGVTRDNKGNPRPLRPRSFATLSQAEEENGQSRIYLGIHWSFDKTAGIAQGKQVSNHVVANVYRPVP